MFPLILFFNSIYSVIPASLFWKSCFCFHLYFKKTALSVFRLLLTAHFCFYQCIVILHLSENIIYVFTMAPVFPTSAAFCSWAIWADHSAAFLGRADYLYVPVVLPVVLHSVSSCSGNPDSATAVPAALYSRCSL